MMIIWRRLLGDSSRKSVPNEHLVHTSGYKRHYLKKAHVKELAEKNYSENGRGITVLDIMANFKVKQGKAQRTVKNLHTKKFLFTGEDLQKQGIAIRGIKRENPQIYYLTEMKAKIIEDNKNNVLNETTGTNLNLVDRQKVRYFRDILYKFFAAMLYIHKLQMMTTIDMKHFRELHDVIFQLTSKKKIYEERIGQQHGPPNVRYVLHANGTIMIYVVCSEKPFRLCCDEDISKIMTFMGRVEDRLRYILSDTRDQIVKPPSEWMLRGCDVNKDVEIDGMMQMTLPGFQMKLFEKVLRGYVKVIESKVCYRLEESLTLNERLPTALEGLRTRTNLENNLTTPLRQ
jgi:hypothetical protein